MPDVCGPLMTLGKFRLEPRAWGEGSIAGYKEERFGQSKPLCMNVNTIITKRLTSNHTWRVLCMIYMHVKLSIYDIINGKY